MRRGRGRPRRVRGEAGSVSVWSVVVVTACLALAGLVLDGGVVLRARSDAFSLAGGAARAGAQELSEGAAQGGELTLDPAIATEAALAYLAARSATGTATVTGTTVHVTVLGTAQLQLLTVVGADSVEVRATAAADALVGP